MRKKLPLNQKLTGCPNQGEWKYPMLSNQRPGLIVIIATLLVMVAMGYLFLDYQRENRLELARAQGVDLVRLLGGMPWSELIPSSGHSNALDILKRGQSNADFAYAAVVDLNGNVAAEVTRSGVIIPTTAFGDEPATWLGQQILQAADGGNRFIEAHGPVFEGEAHMGFVRLGYL